MSDTEGDHDAHGKLRNGVITLDINVQFPKKKKKQRAPPKPGELPPPSKSEASLLSQIIAKQRNVEPVYFQNVDVVAIPNFLSPDECSKLIEVADEKGYPGEMNRPRVWCMKWLDIIDPHLARALWERANLKSLMRTVRLDGRTACGINEVIRIQRYDQGGCFGRHIDRSVEKATNQRSLYSLRVFLNGSCNEFEGGSSVFHLPFSGEPVVFEPETGLALLYAQGELCTPQEETEVTLGSKLVLRCDVLFETGD